MLHASHKGTQSRLGYTLDGLLNRIKGKTIEREKEKLDKVTLYLNLLLMLFLLLPTFATTLL